MSPSVNANCLSLENDDGYIAIRRKSSTLSDSRDEPSDVSVVVEMCVDGFAKDAFVDNCLYYIAGFIIRSLSKVVSCDECILALHEKILDTPDPSVNKLSCRKDRGGLMFSSGSVFKVISITETIISREIVCSSELPNASNLALQIQCKVLDKLSSYSLFPMFDTHFHGAIFPSGDRITCSLLS